MRAISRILAGFGVCLATIGVVASPAAADPAIPTNFKSSVTALDPVSNVVSVKVSGGDSFLSALVTPGHTMIVYGYTQYNDQYLRISADGTIEENLSSPATYVNADRYAKTQAPTNVDGQGPPVWKKVGSGGAYTWHDHRIHFMSPGVPAILSQAGVTTGHVQDWRVPVLIDGVPTTVVGTLDLVAAPSIVFPFILLVAIAALAFIALICVPLLPVLVIASIIAIVVGIGEQRAVAAGAQGQPWKVVLPIIALGLAIGAAALHRKTVIASIAVVGAAALIAAWFVARRDFLNHAVLPTVLVYGVDRYGTVTAGALALAALARALPTLTPAIED